MSLNLRSKINSNRNDALIMKLVVLIVLLLVILGMCEVNRKKNEKWHRFKKMYDKTYINEKEDRKRFTIFKENLKEIREHNKRYKMGLETFRKGINSFADLTETEFEERYNLWMPDDAENIIYNDTSESDDSEKNFDWRNLGFVTPAKDQGSCGSCWIFSAVGAIESFYFKTTGKLIPLSEQTVIDCFSNSTCEGGFPEETVLWVKKHGINTEKDYPYKEKHTFCDPDQDKLLNITISSIVKVNDSEDELKIALEGFGPIVISLAVTGRWRFYKSGVWYSNECTNITNHSMLLVGYGKENGLDYWAIKNSWGRDWGQSGFIKIARNKHKNYCGLTAECFYIV